jgi:hypothetical protein
VSVGKPKAAETAAVAAAVMSELMSCALLPQADAFETKSASSKKDLHSSHLAWRLFMTPIVCLLSEAPADEREHHQKASQTLNGRTRSGIDDIGGRAWLCSKLSQNQLSQNLAKPCVFPIYTGDDEAKVNQN